MAALRPAQPKAGRRSFTYEEWYDMYYDEVNEIVDDLIDSVMEGFCSSMNTKKERPTSTVHSLNTALFSDRLKRKLYETSDNRFKDTAGTWESA